jgi:hypothetical protein
MNKFSSKFGQVLQIFSKKEFYLAVREIQSERCRKGFSSWTSIAFVFFEKSNRVQGIRAYSQILKYPLA